MTGLDRQSQPLRLGFDPAVDDNIVYAEIVEDEADSTRDIPAWEVATFAQTLDTLIDYCSQGSVLLDDAFLVRLPDERMLYRAMSDLASRRQVTISWSRSDRLRSTELSWRRTH